MMDKRTKRSLLIAAAALLVIALTWLVILELNSSIRGVCNQINEYGYAVSPNDFYLQGYGADTTIEQVLKDIDIGILREYSISCGFSANTNKAGRVEVLLWQMDDTRVMTVYTVDGSAQLVFIENTETGEVTPIG